MRRLKNVASLRQNSATVFGNCFGVCVGGGGVSVSVSVSVWREPSEYAMVRTNLKWHLSKRCDVLWEHSSARSFDLLNYISVAENLRCR